VADLTGDLLSRALAAHQQGDRVQAESLYRRALSKEKRNTDALHYFGLLQAENERWDEAAQLLRQAIRFGAKSPDVHANLGRILNLLNRHQEALESYEKALAIDPDHPAALINYAGTLLTLHLPEKALPILDRLIAHNPSLSIASHNRCIALLDLGRDEEVIVATEKILSRNPTDADAWSKRGRAFAALHRYQEATAAYKKFLDIQPRSAPVLTLLGNINVRLNRTDDAATNYDEAIAANKNYAEAWFGRGKLLAGLRYHQQAFDAFDRAYTLQPDLHYIEGHRLHAKLYACDWSNLGSEIVHLRKNVREGKPAAPPFTMLAVSPSPAEQFRCAQAYVRNAFPASSVSTWSGQIYNHDKIRIAYVSGEFRDHPTAYLTADLFECHNREIFDVFAISTGVDDDGPMRRRLVKAFDEFFNAGKLSSNAIAEWIRQNEIDVLIDLNGYSGHDRTDVFLLRPAPVQVNYLAFPGTMGATWMDYIVVDAALVNDDEHVFFSEKVVYLPDSYQPSDRRRAISTRRNTRGEVDLPESGFVYCCFNNSYKIMPDVFDVWMRVLRGVDGSVLWLLEANATVEGNLKREAENRGVGQERLIFARSMPLPEHLSRLQLADLFLDTLPYNAHTTANDALWSGVPVLTCRGSTFAGRVGDSLLRAIGLEELVTGSLDEYERMAVAIGKDANLLADLKSRLQRNRESHPLFDTPRYTRHLEAAYVEMWRRFQRGQEPVSFRIMQMRSQAVTRM
jgi:protein O-GlcNAc transferase